MLSVSPGLRRVGRQSAYTAEGERNSELERWHYRSDWCAGRPCPGRWRGAVRDRKPRASVFALSGPPCTSASTFLTAKQRAPQFCLPKNSRVVMAGT